MTMTHKQFSRVGIVTVNWNGSERTIQGLKEMATFTYPDFVIYVVDNDSTTEEREKLEAFLQTWETPHEYIQAGNNLGFAGGSNLGGKLALQQGAEYVMLLNNDTYAPQKDMIERLVDAVERNQHVGAAGPLIRYAKSEKVWWAGGYVSMLNGFTRHKGKGKKRSELGVLKEYNADYLTGCCLLMTKQAIENIGLLDESYFLYYEEVDWAAKAHQQAYQLLFVPTAELEHDKSASTGEAGSNQLSKTQAYYLARNAFVYARKTMKGPKKWYFMALQLCVRWPINLLFFLRKKGSKRAYFAGIQDGLLGVEGIRSVSTP